MSFINLMANEVWSDADITNRVRSQVESIVPVARQDELRTILLGHIAQMRTATADELTEITLVKTLTEQAAVDAAAARADMALLTGTMAYESALQRLDQPTVDPTEATLDADGVPLPTAHDIDEQERQAAWDVVLGASPEVIALHGLRHPAPVEVVEVHSV